MHMDSREHRKLTRRDLLRGGAGATGAAALVLAIGHARAEPDAPPDSQPEPARPAAPGDTTKAPGQSMQPLAERSRFEQPRRRVFESMQGIATTPIQDQDGILTPTDVHFTRHHAGIPMIDPASWRLYVHGLVTQPRVFDLADLRRLPSRSQICFIECSGNGVSSLQGGRPGRTPEAVDGATSCAEWTGVPLSVLLREVGASPAAKWLLAESEDGARYSRSIPLPEVLGDAMLAYGQNGEPLRPEQGYPVRLLIPGFEGSSQVKWLRRIELGESPWWTREETARYTDILPSGKIRVFALVMEAKSIITQPTFPRRIAPGWWEIRGLAWSGRGRIARVDVSTDGGASWQPAALDAPILPKAHTRFRLPWRYGGGRAVLMSRATDETGAVQPTAEELRRGRVPGNDYHNNSVRAWLVEEDGRIFFRG